MPQSKTVAVVGIIVAVLVSSSVSAIMFFVFKGKGGGPSNAIYSEGTTSDGKKLYSCLAKESNDGKDSIVPGKTWDGAGKCLYAFQGKEKSNDTFEVVKANNGYSWVPKGLGPITNSKVISIGVDRTGDTPRNTVVCRADPSNIGQKHPGKAFKNQSACWVTYDGKEYAVTSGWDFAVSNGV